MDRTMVDWENPHTTATASQSIPHFEVYACDNLQDFNFKLRQKVDDANNALIPELFNLEVRLGPHAMFNIPSELLSVPSGVQLAADNLQSTATPPSKRRKLDASIEDVATQPMSILEVLSKQPEKKPLPIQREVVKTIMASVMQIDGYGWQNHNTTRSKDGWRLEYVCNDSYLNQHRASNKLRRAETAEKKKEARPAALPTFDCQGRIYFIFSISQGRIVFQYSHMPVHRTVESRKLLKQNPVEKKPLMTRVPLNGTPQLNVENRVPSAEPKIPEKQVVSNPLNAPANAYGHVYPSSTPNALRQQNSRNGSRADGASTGNNSPLNSPYQAATPNPLKAPLAMVTVLEHKQRSASIDFSVKRAKALSLLAAAGIDYKTLSDYQMQIFQDQSPDVQSTSLRLFQEYGPGNLMVQVHDMSNDGNSSTAYETSIAAQSLNALHQSQPATDPLNGVSRPSSSYHVPIAPAQSSYAMSNESRTGSTASHTEDASPGIGDDVTQSIADGKSKDVASNTELTVNGTPKQPGVFEHNPKKASIGKASPTLNGTSKGGGKRNRAKSTQPRNRGAAKSGCQACGKRRLKCDGGRPACTNCTKYDMDCMYASGAQPASSPPAQSGMATAPDASSSRGYPGFENGTSDELGDDEAWLRDLIQASLEGLEPV